MGVMSARARGQAVARFVSCSARVVGLSKSAVLNLEQDGPRSPIFQRSYLLRSKYGWRLRHASDIDPRRRITPTPSCQVKLSLLFESLTNRKENWPLWLNNYSLQYRRFRLVSSSMRAPPGGYDSATIRQSQPGFLPLWNVSSLPRTPLDLNIGRVTLPRDGLPPRMGRHNPYADTVSAAIAVGPCLFGSSAAV